MKIFTSKYKTLTSKVESIDEDGLVSLGDSKILSESTPFFIHLVTGYGFELMTFDRKHMIFVNGDVLSHTFNESDYVSSNHE